jgi:hypothetical protein
MAKHFIHFAADDLESFHLHLNKAPHRHKYTLMQTIRYNDVYATTLSFPCKKRMVKVADYFARNNIPTISLGVQNSA